MTTMSNQLPPMASEKNERILELPTAPRTKSRLRLHTGTPHPPLLSPDRAVGLVEELLNMGEEFTGIELAGPGDVLATPGLACDTLIRLKHVLPDIPRGIRTLGLGGLESAASLAEAGADWVSLEIHASDPLLLEGIFSWIRPGKRTVPLPDACKILLKEQKETIRAFVSAGIRVRVRSILFPGISPEHSGEVAAWASSEGAVSMQVFPCHFQGHEETAMDSSSYLEDLHAARRAAARHLELLKADFFSFPCSPETEGRIPTFQGPTPERPNVAVASVSGMEVDVHLGQARELLIYGPRDDGLSCLLETRMAPGSGQGAGNRWEALEAACLHDCFCVVAADAGDMPRLTLAGRGVQVLICPDSIEGVVGMLYGASGKEHCNWPVTL